MSTEGEVDGASGAGGGVADAPFSPEQLAWLDRVIEARSHVRNPTGATPPASAGSLPGGSGLVTAASGHGEREDG